MGEKIVVGPINKGLKTDRTAFNIDNDSFPMLVNAYQWRGRIKRKRGTEFLSRLRRYFRSTSTAYSATTTFALDGSGVGNILVNAGWTLQANGNIVPGTVTLVGAIGPTTYTDPTLDGFLTPTGTGGVNTINYASGLVTIPAQAGQTLSAIFSYYPDLPVMGLEDFVNSDFPYPQTIAFDTTYSYNLVTTAPYPNYDVSFYKNPAADGTNLPGYIPKTVWTPTTWNGEDYQQFWTVNYQGALWATNGIQIPFVESTSKIGMQFSRITAVAAPVGNTVVITVTGPNLVVGDFVYLNEFDPAFITGINFQSGYVIAGAAPGAITIELPFATLAGAGGATTSGIVQYLTNRSNATKDCLRWYDGDPTNGVIPTPGFVQGKGWVNFAPPLSQRAFSIADLPAKIYYLVGARMIVPFKDRLLFIGPVVQTSEVGATPKYLQDTVIYSQNGTPYYTDSYTNVPSAAVDNPTSPGIIHHAILLPINQTATASAYFEDSTGFGGFIQAGIDQPINTTSTNEDVLIMGFSTTQARFVYSGNDVLPFNFFVINSELGSGSTFSIINLDRGVLAVGDRGFTISSQVETKRFDNEIPDQVFEISLVQNGAERVCSQRDFINEWIYFTYPVNAADEATAYKFPCQSVQYNYKDDSWAIFNESYTTYGTFRKVTGYTWATIGEVYETWEEWNDPWNAGQSTLLQPQVIAGNQQGFILVRGVGTGEGTSLYIQSVSGSTITSPSHCLNEGDFITIKGVIGTLSTSMNNKIFKVANTTIDTFTLNPTLPAGTYIGGGLITRMYVPMIQSKQFPVSWGMGRKTRLGPQMYLLDTTDNAQITLLIYLSMNDAYPYNNGPIVPTLGSTNNALIYSTVLYTCPESTNLGLTPANSNLQMPTATSQNQIWHRVNTSLIGDVVQVGFTLSDAQMTAVDEETGAPISQFDEIVIHGFILDANPSQLLS